MATWHSWFHSHPFQRKPSMSFGFGPESECASGLQASHRTSEVTFARWPQSFGMCPGRRAAIVGGDFWGEVGCLRKSNKFTVTVTVTVTVIYACIGKDIIICVPK